MAQKQMGLGKASAKRQKPKLKMLKPRLRELDLSVAKPLKKKKIGGRAMGKTSPEFNDRVRAVLKEAHEAAAAAFTEFKATAQLDRHGQIIDSFGRGDLVVAKPSYRLREALKALGEVARDTDGLWWISNFRIHGHQSLTAAERTCAAARTVFERAFPNDGEFLARIRMD